MMMTGKLKADPAMFSLSSNRIDCFATNTLHLVILLKRRHLVVRALRLAGRAVRLAVVMTAMALIAAAAVVLGLVVLHVVLHQLLEVGGQLEVARGITVSVLVVGVRPPIPVDLEQVLILVLLLRVKGKRQSHLQELRPGLAGILHQMELNTAIRAAPFAGLRIRIHGQSHLGVDILVKTHCDGIFVVLRLATTRETKSSDCYAKERVEGVISTLGSVIPPTEIVTKTLSFLCAHFIGGTYEISFLHAHAQ